MKDLRGVSRSKSRSKPQKVSFDSAETRLLQIGVGNGSRVDLDVSSGYALRFG